MNFEAAALAEDGRWRCGVLMFTLTEAVKKGNFRISTVADIGHDSPQVKGLFRAANVDFPETPFQLQQLNLSLRKGLYGGVIVGF